MQTFPPKIKESEPHIKLPRPGALHWKDEPPKTSDFEGQQNLYSGELESCRKETLLLKGPHKLSHALRPRGEAVI